MMNDILNNTKTGVYTCNEELNNFNFKTNLSIAEKLKFVNSVVDLVVTENRYNSVIRNLVFDFYVIDIMTDIETDDFKSSPTFLNDVEDFLFSINAVEIVKVNAFPTLFDELNNAIDKSIQYLTGIQFNPLNEAIANLFNTIEKKINEVDLDSLMSAAQKFAGMTEEFTMDNLVNSYMNSDVHKKNLADIAEVKNNRAELAEDLDKAIKLVANDKKDNKTKKSNKK